MQGYNEWSVTCIPWQYTGWPRKNASHTINNFKKTRNRMKSCGYYCILNSFPSKMTTRSLIVMKALWFDGRFSEAISFSRFALLSQKSQFTYRIFSIVWLPRVNCQLLLCKAKPAWIIKRNIHYVTLQHYNPGGITQRNSSLPQTWLLIQKEHILKITLPQENGSSFKTPSSKSLILV